MAQELTEVSKSALAATLRQMFKEGYFIERAHARMSNISPDAPPVWMSLEVQEALNAITGEHIRKKRTTILRLAEAEASGTSKRSVFASPDCCNSAAWYGRTGRTEGYDEQPGWKDDEAIAYAFELCRRRAHWYYDQLEEERIAMRRDVLAAAEDRLAEIAPAAVEVLFDVMLDAELDDVRRKAAVDALTHASSATAPKSKAETDVALEIRGGGVSMRDIRHRQRNMEPGGTNGDDIIEGEAVTVAPPALGGLRVPMTADAEPPEFTSHNGDHGDGPDEELGP